MPNHPNRGWRRRAHEAAAQWLSRWRWRWRWRPEAPDAHLSLTQHELRAMLTDTYLAGYEAGRLDGRPRREA